MDSLAGQKLVKADGSSHEADAVLADKELVMYYFSAHWCPPCRQFTPMLKDFYDVSVFLFIPHFKVKKQRLVYYTSPQSFTINFLIRWLNNFDDFH